GFLKTGAMDDSKLILINPGPHLFRKIRMLRKDQKSLHQSTTKPGKAVKRQALSDCFNIAAASLKLFGSQQNLPTAITGDTSNIFPTAGQSQPEQGNHGMSLETTPGTTDE